MRIDSTVSKVSATARACTLAMPGTNRARDGQNPRLPEIVVQIECLRLV